MFYFLNTQMLKCFIYWRRLQIENYLNSVEELRGLDHFRDRMIRTFPFEDFICEVVEELQTCTESLDGQLCEMIPFLAQLLGVGEQ